jgi:hypothetical protein
MERGWDPEVKKYFRKVFYSVAIGLGWMMACVTAGIYFHLGYWNSNPLIYPLLFYSLMIISLALLLRWYYRTWKK